MNIKDNIREELINEGLVEFDDAADVSRWIGWWSDVTNTPAAVVHEVINDLVEEEIASFNFKQFLVFDSPHVKLRVQKVLEAEGRVEFVRPAARETWIATVAEKTGTKSPVVKDVINTMTQKNKAYEDSNAFVSLVTV